MLGRFRGRGGAIDKGSARRHREAGRAALERGDHAHALESFDAAALADPKSAWTWHLIAQAQLAMGARAASYEAIGRALELRPDEPNATWHLVTLLEEDGRIDECRDRIRRLCEAHANEPPVLKRGSQILTRVGARATVIAMAKEILVARPENAELVAAIAAGLDAGGASGDAEELLRTQLADGSNARAIAGAWMDWWGGRPTEGWDRVRSIAPEVVGSSLLVRLGRSLRTQGELEAAKDALAAAATIDPDHERAQRMSAITHGVWVHTSGRWHATPSTVVQGRAVPGRVLHIVTRSRPYWQSGYTIRTRYVTASQQALGLEPHVVTQFGFPMTAGFEGAPSTHMVDGVPHHHLLQAGAQALMPDDERLTASLEGMATLVHELRPAVLHAASDHRNALLALRLGELYRLPVVYEVRGFPEEGMEARSSEWYRSRLERETECMERADALVTLSEGMADEIVSRGIDRSRITLVPNGVDIDHFVPVSRDHELARRWGIRPDEVTLGYISTFSPYEGIGYLIEAGSRLIASGMPVRVVLVGTGWWLPELERQVADLGMGDRVIFTGRVPHDEVLAYYGLIDIFVVPRTDERVSQLVTPLKPFEAMATGRAMIVSGVAALRGMVQEGITAEIFRPEDPGHLAEVAAGLARDPQRRTALGAAARDWVVENRSWTKLAQSYVELYRRLGAVV